jgi:hypothetical protein
MYIYNYKAIILKLIIKYKVIIVIRNFIGARGLKI